jgi:hypothetical protein
MLMFVRMLSIYYYFYIDEFCIKPSYRYSKTQYSIIPVFQHSNLMQYSSVRVHLVSNMSQI